MPFRERSYWLVVGALAYVCTSALRTAPEPLVPLLALGALSLFLAETWRRTRRAEIGDRRLDRAALSAVRMCHFGAALWVGARLGEPGHPGHDAIANLGTAISSIAALVALARLPSEGGLLLPPPTTRSLDAAAFTGLLWGVAIALPATRALLPSGNILLDPIAIDYATTTAGIGTLLVFVAASVRLRAERKLEIGAADRIGGALVLSLTGLAVALPTSLFDIAAPDRVLPAAAIATSLACCFTATTRKSRTVSAALRGVLAIMILGVPATLFVAIAARAYPLHAAPIALVGSAIAIGVGLVARDVARPLGPEQSRWLSAVEKASHGALQPDPDAAIRAALAELRAAYRDPNAKPELFRTAPEEVLSVDVAGYLHVEKARVPEQLSLLAGSEPERTLRTDVLRAVQVRRADVRPLLAWFEARDAFCATTVVDEEGPLGFLLFPRAGRKRQLTLEEAHAVRRLGDRISALLAVSSALARSRQRELASAALSARVDAECQRLTHIIDATSARHRASAELVARSARIALYSAAARFAADELERQGRTGAPLSVLVPHGVDGAGFAAIAHLASPTAGGPLVIVDGATISDHDEATWQDPTTSPVALADGGTLIVLDAPALPLSFQDQLVRSFDRRASESPVSNVPPPRIIVCVRKPFETLLVEGSVTRPFAARFATNHVELPELAARAEDLRSLVLDRLARFGMREGGEPLGIDARALAVLLEHRWPGNDLELDDVLVRAARIATGTLVTVEHLTAIGFKEEQRPETKPPLSVAPEPTRRRRARPARTLR